ncbi:MAG: substrate-binding domain-containing protein [Bacteroides sp.]|nr:substrate-binding domain-containing protein [Bacteroides sp.]
MKKSILSVVLVWAILWTYTSCDKEEHVRSKIIEGLTLDNYPKIDGSTSTAPLNLIIACKLLDIDYQWVNPYSNLKEVEPKLNKKNAAKLKEQIRSSQTHPSIIHLIDKETDLILSARTMSPDEKAHAEAAGVSLIETPIALDAFVFIIHPDNEIESLTTKQVQDIYTGQLTNWKEVGGSDSEIHAYVRNANSGSQELTESLVMKDLDITDLPESPYELMAFTMTGAFEVVDGDRDAICYTVYYYKEHIITTTPVKSIAMDGVYADKQTIANKSYPFVAEVYAVIRSDLDKSSMAYQIYNWLQTTAGKQTISESGYIPYE